MTDPTDPFEALRRIPTPVVPDADFAIELRARLERALALPTGVTMTTTSIPQPSALPAAPSADAQPVPAAIPYLAVRDARAAIDWYVNIFEAHLLGDPIVMPDDRIGHAELQIGDGVIYLADEHPALGVVAPRPGEAAVSLMLPVDDADAVRERALAAGASGDRPPYDGYGTRNAWIVDPFGHRWGLQSPLPATAGPAPDMQWHDLAYVSLQVPDAARALSFWSGVTGWAFDGWHVREVTPSIGIFQTAEGPALFCCFRVHDLDAAAERVRAAGGTAGEPHPQAAGHVVECVDDQGNAFALYEGDVGEGADHVPYMTFQVPDSERARAFYGAVLGWEFTPGRVADGWQVTNTVPPMGLSGGHPRNSTVPMWRVRDVAAAVVAVRAAGGTASDPAAQPYGLSSEGTDDQGLHFYLLQE